MDRKTGATDTTTANERKIELINRKVKEINERRRGVKTTAFEDDLDRQELRNYMRLLGVGPEDIRLESWEEKERPVRNNIFYAIIGVEALIELSIAYYIASLLLRPGASVTEWGLSGLLGAIFLYLGYRIYQDLRYR